MPSVRIHWYIVLAVLLAAGVLRSSTLLAGEAVSPGDIVTQCVNEMDFLYGESTEETLAQLMDFEQEIVFRRGVTVTRAFRAAAATSARMEKTAMSKVSKVERTSSRCVARLRRLGAGQQFIDAVEDSAAENIDAITTHLRVARQAALVAYLDNLTSI